MTTPNGAGANPLAGGRGADPPATNPLAGALSGQTPAHGAPDGKAGSNPLAGGSSDGQNAPDDDTPVSAAQHREALREAQSMRKRMKELEDRVKREDDAKLSDEQRKEQEIEALRAEKQAWDQREKELRLQSAVETRVRERNLVDPEPVAILLRHFYGDQLDYDDNKIPSNAEYFVDRLVEKFSWLIRTPETPPPPTAGRQVSPPRSPFAQQQPQRASQPKPVEQWAKLGDYDWSKPGGNNS